MKIREDLILRKIGGENLIIDPSQDMVDMSRVITLNETAAFLWEQLFGKEFTTDDVEHLLLSHYEVEKSDAEKDVQLFITKLKNASLIDG